MWNHTLLRDSLYLCISILPLHWKKTTDVLKRNISMFSILKTTYLHSFNFIATIFQPLEHKCHFANLQFKFNFNFNSIIFFMKTLDNAQYSKLKRNSAEMISFCCLIESLFQFNLQSIEKFCAKLQSMLLKSYIFFGGIIGSCIW